MKVPMAKAPSPRSQGILQSRWTWLQINECLAEAQTNWSFPISICACHQKRPWAPQTQLESPFAEGGQTSLCFGAAGTLSQTASWDSGRSQTYRTMIPTLQTYERVFFKTFSSTVILKWIIHASVVAAHLQCSTCPSVCMHLCVSVLVDI